MQPSPFRDFELKTKTCSGECGSTLPLDEAHFHRDITNPTGFRDECIECRSQRRKNNSIRQQQRRVAKLDQAALNTLELASSGQYNKLPHIAEVFECLMRAFGGPQGFAQHFLGTYLTAQPGSQQRVKLLNIMSIMANQVTQTGAAKVPKELLSEEDLEREIAEVGQRLRVALPPPLEGEAVA